MKELYYTIKQYYSPIACSNITNGTPPSRPLAMIKKTYDVASATQTVAIMNIATKTSHPSPNLHNSACCVFKFLSSLSLSLSLCFCSHGTHNVSSGSTSSYVGLIPICYVGRTRSRTSYGNPEHQNAQGPAAHKLLTRSAQGSHQEIMRTCEL